MPSDSTIHLLGVIVTILIFLAGILWNSNQDRAKRDQQIKDDEEKQKKIRHRYLIALKEEIRINVKALEKSIGIAEAFDKVDTFLKENKANRPMVTYAYFTTLYSTRTEVLQDLDEELINGIVDFYAKLAELKTDIDALESKAFETISDSGRMSCVRSITEESKLAKQQGQEIARSIGLVVGNH